MNQSNRMRNEIAVVGSMNMDLAVTTQALPRPGETVVGSSLVQSPGGKGANQAVSAALLGGKVSLIAMTGDDNFGKLLVDSAMTAGVDVDLVQVDYREKTGTAVITVDASAENTIVISPGANKSLMPALARACLLKAGELAVVSACMEVPYETVLESLKTGQEIGAITVLNLSPFDRISTNLIPFADVLIVNQHELAEIIGIDELVSGWAACRDALRILGAKSAVVTLGPDGAVVLDCEDNAIEPELVDAMKVEAIDTTGCGDAFAGAICAELASGATLGEAAKFAARAASYAAKFPGAQNSYGTRAQVLSS